MRVVTVSVNGLREAISKGFFEWLVEQDADVVMILHMPDEQNDPWHAELLVAKARAGRRDAVDLHMATHFATIASAARNRALDRSAS